MIDCACAKHDGGPCCCVPHPRTLAALLFVALTTESAAQSFPLPYNPDENGDGLIGVADLQGLLSNYGSEFSGAVISEDGESLGWHYFFFA